MSQARAPPSAPDTLPSWLDKVLKDPLIHILLGESHLTQKQLQALLIDILSEDIAQKPISYCEKGSIMQKPVTRGAFNRILRAARNNVSKSFFTIHLLSYVGIIGSGQLQKHIQLGSKIRHYVQAYRQAESTPSQDFEARTIIDMIHKELVERISSLAKPISMKRET